MKLKQLFGLLVATLVAIIGINTVSVAGNQPTDVQVTLAPQGSEYSIQSSMTTFKPGVKYRFVVRNAGRKLHEFVVSPRGEADARKALLEIEEDDLRPNMVAMGTATFAQAGEYELSCRYANHYEKGMVLPIDVK